MSTRLQLPSVGHDSKLQSGQTARKAYITCNSMPIVRKVLSERKNFPRKGRVLRSKTFRDWKQ